MKRYKQNFVPGNNVGPSRGIADLELSLAVSWQSFKLFAIPGFQENQICLKRAITSNIGAFQKSIIMTIAINY